MLFRFRGSAGVVRQQMKWVAWAVMMTVLLVTVQITLVDGPAGSIAMDLVSVVLSAAIAVAIVRHNLFDIDRILSRSLLYAGLTGIVVGLYIGSVSLFGLVLQHSASRVAALLATGVVAVALQPLRDVLQRLVSRLVYGLRDDPYAALAELGRRLEAPPIRKRCCRRRQPRWRRRCGCRTWPSNSTTPPRLTQAQRASPPTAPNPRSRCG
ncbi:hypothetical protein [Streptomyces sp. NBC_01794]|uniref:hypothetical protein n=1 Tax=Streptomyces sp. NBC_01794 TaxID=2975942 RepID=UPI0030903FD1|nr:hypothetical protein OIE54_41585 [Streptomyces sp. NBC_01794]